MAVRGEGVGHCTLTTEACGCCGGGGGVGRTPNGEEGGGDTGSLLTLCTTVPPISNLALLPPPITGGLMASCTIGVLPPVWKNASRICAARWNSSSVAGDNERVTGLSCRHAHVGREVS